MVNAGHVVLKVSDAGLISLQQNNLWTPPTVDRDNVQHNGDGIRFHLQVEGKMYKATLIFNIYHMQVYTSLLT